MYKTRRLRREYSTCIGSIISVGRRIIHATPRIVHIASFRGLRREYSTCIGGIMSEGRRRIRDTWNCPNSLVLKLVECCCHQYYPFKCIKLGD